MKICTYLAWQSTKFLAAHATELFQRSATSLNRQHLQFSNFFEGEENIKALFKKGVFLNKGGNNGGSKGDHKINSARSVLWLSLTLYLRAIYGIILGRIHSLLTKY